MALNSETLYKFIIEASKGETMLDANGEVINQTFPLLEGQHLAAALKEARKLATAELSIEAQLTMVKLQTGQAMSYPGGPGGIVN